MKKDVIYVDSDDEITSIVDKIQNSKLDLIALVLPKRCTVLQSSVNMKILKKTVDESSKQVVLITSEAAVLPIAGTAGLYVAKNLQSKPEIPEAPVVEEETTQIANDEPDISPDPNKSIGELAGVAAVSTTINRVDAEKPIEIGGDDNPAGKEKPKKDKKADKKDRKLKVPDFSKFRTKLFIGLGALSALIVVWIFMTMVLPKASIAVKIQYNSVPVNISATGDPQASSLNEQQMIVPTKTQTAEKTESVKFQATGQKDIGNKASGKVVFYNCNKDDKLGDVVRTVPAGTAIASSGFTFITQSEVAVQPSGFNGNSCKYDKASSPINVVAQSGGDKYNLSPRDYSVSGFPSMTASDDNGMSGGTSKMVTIISQSDCDTAKNTILNKKYDDQKTQLASQLSAGGFSPITDSFAADNSGASCSPDVGSEASESTASVKVKMSMSGVSTDAMNQLIQNEVNNNIDQNTEKMYDNGLKEGKFTVNEKKSNGSFSFTYTGEAKTGVKQDTAAMSKAVAGKKYGETVEILKGYSGVTDVTVKYSPFWVKKTPKNTSHITIVFSNSNGSQ